MALTRNELQGMVGHRMLDESGDKIGTIDQVYLDTRSGQPEWLTVKTGLLGSRVNFVPTRGSHLEGDDLQVPYGKSFVKDAPSIDPDEALNAAEERELYQYYGVEFGGRTTPESAYRRPPGQPSPSGERRTGRDPSARSTDDPITPRRSQ